MPSDDYVIDMRSGPSPGEWQLGYFVDLEGDKQYVQKSAGGKFRVSTTPFTGGPIETMDLPFLYGTPRVNAQIFREYLEETTLPFGSPHTEAMTNLIQYIRCTDLRGIEFTKRSERLRLFNACDTSASSSYDPSGELAHRIAHVEAFLESKFNL